MASNHQKLSAAGVLVTLGIIFGDIGTSPLYVLRSIIQDRPITEVLVYGGVSCIFWTLTIQTTFKYIFLTLRADNNGEGGIFSLYSLVKRKGKWLQAAIAKSEKFYQAWGWWAVVIEIGRASCRERVSSPV